MGKFNKGYAGLFGERTGEDDGDDKQRGGGNGFAEVYGWHFTLDNLSNCQPEKWDYFLNLPVIEFLNLVSYYKSKQAYERQMIKNASRNK